MKLQNKNDSRQWRVLCSQPPLVSLRMPLDFLCVTEADLYKSEPPPDWFGNAANSKKDGLAWTNDNWLKSRFHFSFAECACRATILSG